MSGFDCYSSIALQQTSSAYVRLSPSPSRAYANGQLGIRPTQRGGCPWPQPELGASAPIGNTAWRGQATPDGARSEWFWHQVCKTQYASLVNDDHLVFCHTTLVVLLDYAIESGWDVIVRDEGHYSETRDPGRLVQEVRHMNRIVARIAGALSDRLESVGQPLAPIFDHPEFEHLEIEKPQAE